MDIVFIERDNTTSLRAEDRIVGEEVRLWIDISDKLDKRDRLRKLLGLRRRLIRWDIGPAVTDGRDLENRERLDRRYR